MLVKLTLAKIKRSAVVDYDGHPPNELCSTIRCKTDSRKSVMRAGPALEGTPCGDNKWCNDGIQEHFKVAECNEKEIFFLQVAVRATLPSIRPPPPPSTLEVPAPLTEVLATEEQAMDPRTRGPQATGLPPPDPRPPPSRCPRPPAARCRTGASGVPAPASRDASRARGASTCARGTA